MASVIIFANGMSASCWCRHFRFLQHPDFFPRGLSSNRSLLGAATPETIAPLRVRLPVYISVTDGLFSSSPAPPLGVKPMFSLQLDGWF